MLSTVRKVTHRLPGVRVTCRLKRVGMPRPWALIKSTSATTSALRFAVWVTRYRAARKPGRHPPGARGILVSARRAFRRGPESVAAGVEVHLLGAFPRDGIEVDTVQHLAVEHCEQSALQVERDDHTGVQIAHHTGLVCRPWRKPSGCVSPSCASVSVQSKWKTSLSISSLALGLSALAQIRTSVMCRHQRRHTSVSAICWNRASSSTSR